MKIKSIEESVFEYIETDNDDCYRRYGSGWWERLYGQSWEPCNFTEEETLERLYQEFKIRSI